MPAMHIKKGGEYSIIWSQNIGLLFSVHQILQTKNQFSSTFLLPGHLYLDLVGSNRKLTGCFIFNLVVIYHKSALNEIQFES